MLAVSGGSVTRNPTCHWWVECYRHLMLSGSVWGPVGAVQPSLPAQGAELGGAAGHRPPAATAVLASLPPPWGLGQDPCPMCDPPGAMGPGSRPAGVLEGSGSKWGRAAPRLDLGRGLRGISRKPAAVSPAPTPSMVTLGNPQVLGVNHACVTRCQVQREVSQAPGPGPCS